MSDIAVVEHVTKRYGDSWERTATITEEDGDPYNLTGTTLWFTVKAATDTANDDTAAPIKLYRIVGGTGDGITVTTPSTGVATIKATRAQMETLTPGLTYVFDLQILEADGDVFTPDSGVLLIERDVTRRIVTP